MKEEKYIKAILKHWKSGNKKGWYSDEFIRGIEYGIKIGKNPIENCAPSWLEIWSDRRCGETHY